MKHLGVSVSVEATVSVSERVAVLCEPDDGVVWLHATVLRAPHGASEALLTQARLHALLDARWEVAQAARGCGLVPFCYPLGTRGSFPMFFDGERVAVRFKIAPVEDRSHFFDEIVTRES